MKKTASASHSSSMEHRLCLVVGGLLLLVILGMGLKYMKLKRAWHSYGVKTLQSIDYKQDMKSAEQAAVIAMTVGQVPSANPLYKQPQELQKFVTSLSQQTKRDIVIVDSKEMILADTIPANVGKTFEEDKNGEVGKTIADGQTMTFIEKGTDYPNGINQTVVVLQDASGKTVGAVIFSDVLAE